MLGYAREAILFGSAGYQFVNAEAAAFVARMTTAPDDTRKALIDALFTSLKSASVLTKLECLYLTAAHAAQAARLNWISSSFTASALNSPAFVTDRGYTSDGSASYISSGFDPSASVIYLQDSAHMGVWLRTNATGSTQNDIGNSRARINSRNSTNATLNMNRAGADSAALPIATSIGHTSWVRTSSTADESFKNGVSMGAGLTTASAARMSEIFYLLATNSAGTAGSFSTRQMTAAHWGSALTTADNLALYNALNTFLTAIGAA